jgi:hypothetical protein
MPIFGATSKLKLKAPALTRGMFKQASATMLLAALVPVAGLIATDANALPCASTVPHCTDGTFSTPAEWDVSRSTVSKSIFAPVAGAGGTALYAEQQGGVLYLMYDRFAPPVLSLNPFFDVFFQVEDEDYLVRITQFGISPLSVWVKPASIPSSINPGGSFNTGPPWVLLSTADPAEFALAQFIGAIGFGASPDNATIHTLAEFELTIDQTAFAAFAIPPPGPQPGIYDPAPAFWGASTGNCEVFKVNDPFCPVNPSSPTISTSSAEFLLNPDGSTKVTPRLDSNGAPIMQGNVPEPDSLLLFVLGLAALVATSRRRKGTHPGK